MSSLNISNPSSERLAKLSWKERLGYGVGDAGFNFYWALIGSYLAAFYTDTLGLSAAIAALVIFWAKIVDAFTDQIWQISPLPNLGQYPDGHCHGIGLYNTRHKCRV